MIDDAFPRALAAHLSALHHTRVVTPDDAVAVGARALLSTLARSVPAVAPLADELTQQAEHVSVTFPTPAGTVIVLSPAAVADPVQYACTVAHEHQHAVQLATGGAVATSIDYVASPELRARAEADAYAVGLFVGYLLTGVPPLLDASLASLAGDTYHLARREVTLAQGVLASHVATMAGGLCPPLTIATEVLTFLREEWPDLILAGPWQ